MSKNKAFDNNSDASQVQKRVLHLRKSNGTSVIYDWAHSLFFALATVLIVLTFFVRLVDVSGSSMENTLQNGDKVILTNFFYKPKTGDIVVISHGANYAEPIIKRVIATEGQRLEIDFDKQIIKVDGKVLQEDYAIGRTDDNGGVIPEVIPENKVFVLGDNRSRSLDSRSPQIGLINEEDIIGKAQFVVYPFNSSKTLD